MNRIATRYGDTLTVGDLVSWDVVSQHQKKRGIIKQFIEINGLSYAIIDQNKMYIQYINYRIMYYTVKNLENVNLLTLEALN